MIPRGRAQPVSILSWLERHPYLLPILILILGGVFRFYNLNWDNGSQLHPDERGIYMLVSGSNNNPPLGWPTSIGQFFDVQDPTGGSPLNPHYFAYGSLPYYLLALVAGTMQTIGQHVPGYSAWANADTYGGLPPVGRGISATLTLFSVLLLFLLGRRIWGYWVGVLAMALGAFTVLDIQLAHFYQSDTVLLPLTLLTLLAAVGIVRNEGRRPYVWAGIALGAALATKTTDLLLVIPLGVAAVLGAWRTREWGYGDVSRGGEGGGAFEPLPTRGLQGVVFSRQGAWSLVRAFMGMGGLARGRMNAGHPYGGEAGGSPSVWWGRFFARVRAQYAAVAEQLNGNLQWLLGTYFIAAMTFAVLEPYGILDRQALLRDIAEQTSLLVKNDPPFGVPYVLQYAHTTPYLFQLKNMLFWTLGIPLAVAAFGGVLFAVWRLLRGRLRPEGIVILCWIVPYFLFVGSFFAKFDRYMLPITPLMSLLGAAALVWLIRRRRVRWRALGVAVTAVAVGGSFLYSLAYMNIYAQDNTRVAASRWVYAHIPKGSSIAQEGPWDETLPLDVDGHSGGTTYTFANDPKTNAPYLDPYAGELAQSDEETKIADFTKVLTQYQYIIMSSERMDRSVARVPDRLPVAYRYYQLLFSNRLNFRLVAHFQNHPQLGPFVVHDYPADESFHVYDHPDVRIFKRVGPISAARVRQLLTTGLPSVASVDPQATAWILRPKGLVPDTRLMLTPTQWAANQHTGTMNSMFPANGFGMQHPILVWLLVLELLGLIAFPFTFVLFGRFLDRGFVIGKTIGLMVVGYGAWIVVSVGIWEYTRGLLFVAAGLITLLSVLLAYRMRQSIRTAVRTHWKYMLAGEIVFLAAFAFFAFLRAWYPDLGHEFSPVGPQNLGGGRMGEKQMELAYLNGIVRSRVFPPLDPFFAHGYINYYYYGFYLVSVLCKFTNIAPATGFNLAIATFAALLLSTVFSLTMTLTRRITPGVLAALFVGIFGNLNGGWQLIRGLMSVGTIHSDFPLTGGVVNVISGLQQVLFNGQPLPSIDYWEARSIFPSGSISEFPFFTYLFADLHPHLMAYPMAAAAIAVGVNLLRGGYVRWPGRVLAVLLSGVLVGGIAVTNPWDFPMYLAVLLFGALAGAWAVRRRLTAVVITRPLAWLVSLGLLSLIFYLPFKNGYQTVFTTGVGLVRDITPELLVNTGVCGGPSITYCPDMVHDALVTPLRIYLEHFGFFLFLLVSYLLVMVESRMHVLRKVQRWGTRLQFLLYYRDRWDRVRRVRRVAARMRVSRPIATKSEGSAIWGVLILIAGLIVLRYYLLAFLVTVLGLVGLSFARLGPRLRRAELFTLGLVTLALAISLLTQIFFFKDFLAGGAQFRMNTIFKFYDQAWLLFAIASALAVYFFMDRLMPGRRWMDAHLVQIGGGGELEPLPTPVGSRDVVGRPSDGPTPGNDYRQGDFLDPAAVLGSGTPALAAEGTGASFGSGIADAGVVFMSQRVDPRGRSVDGDGGGLMNIAPTPTRFDVRHGVSTESGGSSSLPLVMHMAETTPGRSIPRRWAPSGGSGLPLSRFWRSERGGVSRPLVLLDRHRWWGMCALALAFACLVYTYGGTLTRERDRSTWLPQSSVPLTMDGMAFMKVAYPDEYAAINWLNDNVTGTPVIAEAGPEYYDWRSRVSMFTGLPDIINGIHEGEQRWADELDPTALCDNTRDPAACQATTRARADDVTTLYKSASIPDAWRVIHTYGVRYIYRGFAETLPICTRDQCYAKAGLAKFDRMVGHGLRVAFRNKTVTIFEVTGA